MTDILTEYAAGKRDFAGDERIKKLDKMLCTRFARSAPIEEALLQIGMGKRDLPTREECKEWGVKLGVPEEYRAKPAATARAETAEGRDELLETIRAALGESKCPT